MVMAEAWWCGVLCVCYPLTKPSWGDRCLASDSEGPTPPGVFLTTKYCGQTA